MERLPNTPDPSSWFFEGLCTAFARLEQADRVLFQELCYTEEGRKTITWELAGAFLSMGLRPVKGEATQPLQPIKELISQELLAGCLLLLMEEHPEAKTLQDWTISQWGWYGEAKKPGEGEESQDAPGEKKQSGGYPLSIMQDRSTRPSRNHRSHRPGRSARGATDELWPL